MGCQRLTGRKNAVSRRFKPQNQCKFSATCPSCARRHKMVLPHELIYGSLVVGLVVAVAIIGTDAKQLSGIKNLLTGEDKLARQRGQNAPFAPPELGSCGSSGRAWWFWLDRYFQRRVTPSAIELAASFHRV